MCSKGLLCPTEINSNTKEIRLAEHEYIYE